MLQHMIPNRGGRFACVGVLLGTPRRALKAAGKEPGSTRTKRSPKVEEVIDGDPVPHPPPRKRNRVVREEVIDGDPVPHPPRHKPSRAVIREEIIDPSPVPHPHRKAPKHPKSGTKPKSPKKSGR